MRPNKVFASASEISTPQGCRVFSAVWPLDASFFTPINMDPFSISLAVAPLIRSSAKLTIVISAVKGSYKNAPTTLRATLTECKGDSHESLQDPRAGSIRTSQICLQDWQLRNLCENHLTMPWQDIEWRLLPWISNWINSLNPKRARRRWSLGFRQKQGLSGRNLLWNSSWTKREARWNHCNTLFSSLRARFKQISWSHYKKN